MAGIWSVDVDGRIQLANLSAEVLLEAEESALVGKPLADAAPELAQIIDAGQGEMIVQIERGLETQTLAVKLVEVAGGPVLTFNDISQQLSDQRRAAWADVARRLAPEIQNPTTPHQLSAHRLQRKSGGGTHNPPHATPNRQS